MNWDGDDYQRRFDALAASGVDVHGEATFVAAYAPASVLDAGCGTGRVAIELARRGIEVVGVDADASMLATARATSVAVEWVLADLTTLALGRRFDVVVLAGNVPLFTPKGTEAALVAGCAAHVGADSILIAGFQLGRGYTLAELRHALPRCAGSSSPNASRTWDRAPFTTDSDYAVSVHRRIQDAAPDD